MWKQRAIGSEVKAQTDGFLGPACRSGSPTSGLGGVRRIRCSRCEEGVSQSEPEKDGAELCQAPEAVLAMS